MSEPALFDGYEAPPIAPGLSADRRRTLRQEAALMRRVHPLQLAVSACAEHLACERALRLRRR